MKKWMMGILIVMAVEGLAQEKKFWVGGGLSFDQTDIKDEYINTFILVGPELGYMLNDRIGIGLNAYFQGNRSDLRESSGQEIYSEQMKTSLFLRYYKEVTENFSFFGQLNLPYSSHSFEIQQDDSTTSHTRYAGYGINVQPGIQYWFSPRFSILATIGEIGYETGKESDEFDEDAEDRQITRLSFNLSGSTNFSLLFHF